MTILCGTDFSESARRALVAAGALARRRRTSVRLVHVLDIPGAAEVLSERVPSRVTTFLEAEERRLLARLEEEAHAVRARVPVACEVLSGPPAEAILAHAERTGAETIVVSAAGLRGERRLRLGRTADRVAQHARAPVLVVRQDEPFRAWDAGARPLRVLVGLDLSATSDATLRWLGAWTAAGPCALVGVHVYWPPEVRERFRQRDLPIGEAEAEVAAALERELRLRLVEVAPDLAGMRIRMVGGMGRVAAHVAEVAQEESADLLALGTHQREGLERLWRGSVSRDLIVHGPCSALIVPA
jgi:nucleotide-binding universal stress UspA family protein